MNNFYKIIAIALFTASAHATDVTKDELQVSMPTVLRINVIDWNTDTNIIYRGCTLGFMSQLSSINTNYLFSDCSLVPITNKMPTYSEQNIYSNQFVELGINEPTNQLHEYYDCYRVEETTVVEGDSPNQYNLRSIKFECGSR